MLFDLRGRGRRRTVKIVYITLALLMGGGLVLFGIGGGGAMQGGLVDAITGSSGGDAGSERFDQREREAAAASRRNPQQPAAWAALAPKKPDDRVASLMVRAFDQTGLNRPADAATAQEIITEARPSATTYATLAIYAYQAGQTRKGALARAQGRAQHPQGLARPGQAAGRGPAAPAAAGLDYAHADPDAQEGQVEPGVAGADGLGYHLHPRPCSSTGRAADS